MLAKLTPQETCRNMEVFPVVVAEEEEAIYVGVKDGSLGPGFVSQSFKGGSDTSLENNNAFWDRAENVHGGWRGFGG